MGALFYCAGCQHELPRATLGQTDTNPILVMELKAVYGAETHFAWLCATCWERFRTWLMSPGERRD